MNERKKVTEEESKKGIKEEQNIFENRSIEYSNVIYTKKFEGYASGYQLHLNVRCFYSRRCFVFLYTLLTFFLGYFLPFIHDIIFFFLSHLIYFYFYFIFSLITFLFVIIIHHSALP